MLHFRRVSSSPASIYKDSAIPLMRLENRKIGSLELCIGTSEKTGLTRTGKEDRKMKMGKTGYPLLADLPEVGIL